MAKYVAFWVVLLLGVSVAGATGPDYAALANRKRALELELQYVEARPGAYYLVIDLPSAQVELKADANLLRTCPIRGLTDNLPQSTRPLIFRERLDPFTVEPGNAGLRHRGRLFPLDFIGRLLEGPRAHSRLFFSPALLLQAPELPRDAKTPTVLLDGEDIKALGAALQQGAAAILIPAESATETSP